MHCINSPNFRTALVVAFCCLTVSACKRSEEGKGQWFQSAGGRMVYGVEVKYDVPRLIYRIDNDRYFTMMTNEGHCGVGGEITYHDEKRNLHQVAGTTSVSEFPMLNLLSDQYMALPRNHGDLQSGGTLFFRRTTAKLGNEIFFESWEAGAIVKDDLLIFLDGYPGVDGPAKINGIRIWKFSQLSKIKADSYDQESPNFFTNRTGEWVRRETSWDNQAEKIGTVDFDNIISRAPPSGWKHLACDSYVEHPKPQEEHAQWLSITTAKT